MEGGAGNRVTLTDRDARVLWHPYTQMKTAPPPLPIVRGEGVWLFTEDGRKILDGISSWWVNTHGHNHPALNAAIAKQAAQLEHVMFAGFTHPPAVELAERLVSIAPHGLSRVFYSDNGSTAVEVALKMALQYWRNRGENERARFIALHDAYHGDTVGTMSTSEESVFTRSFTALLFDVLRADRCSHEWSSCDGSCLASLRSLFEQHRGEIAAVIVEPILQGAGGMLISSPQFLAGVRRLCNEHGVLLIADEVLTGFGRTGRMFACEHAGISPDLMCLSKGLTAGYLPMGATLANEEIYEAFLSDDRSKTFFHGHSYTANPLACAVGLASLDLFEQNDVLQRIVRLEAQMRERLMRFADRAPVASIRQVGGVAVLELGSGDGGYLDSIGPTLYGRFLERGILLRPLGNVLYFMPPYAITDAEVDFVFDEIERVLWRVD